MSGPAESVRPPTPLGLWATAARYGTRAPAYRRRQAHYRVGRVDRLLGLASRRVVAVGRDAWRTEAFRRAGAVCLVVGPDPGADGGSDRAGTDPAGGEPGGTVVGDRYWLPVRDGAADLAYCAAACPAGPEAFGLLDELARITRVGGLVCLSPSGARGPLFRHIRRRPDLALIAPDFAARLRHGLVGELILRRTA